MIPPLLGALLLIAGATDPGEAPHEQAPLTFQFAGCADDMARDIEELVRADVSWAPGDPPATLGVRCQDQSVWLTLAADDAAIVERTLDLSTTLPEARARTAALVAAELILMARQPVPPILPEHRATVIAAPAAPASGPAPSIAIAPARAGPAERPAVALLALAGASVQQAAGRPLTFAGGVRWRWSPSPVWGLTIDGEALYQRRTYGLGTFWGAGGDLLALGEARARFSGGAFHAGVGARVVVLRLDSSYVSLPYATTTSAWGAAVGPVARLAVTREGRRVVSELALTGGWCGPDVVFQSSATNNAIGVGGWWMGASLAAGWTLGVD